ncbi:MAG: methionyl-tRNA formyltransferase [Breznakia sp.]
MKSLKIIFMGTPAFACAVLESLLKSDHEVIAVVSQPDKKVGRKQERKATPVKQMALAYDVPVFQPNKISESYDKFLTLKADLIVTCAYGQMIPEIILEYPKYGSLNVHASLLPKLRGGAPIHKAIMYGYTSTGISIMRMEKRMDAGDYMLQRAVDIAADETMIELHNRLMPIAAETILEAISLLVKEKAIFTKQEEADVSFAYNISKEEEYIDASADVEEVYNHIKSLISWPVGYILFQEKKLKIHGAKRSTLLTSEQASTLVQANKKLFLVCNNGCIELCSVQLEGRKRNTAKDFLNGFKEEIKDVSNTH